MASLQSAMTPAIPADPGAPLVRPRSVTIASVLVMVAGVLFLLIGALSVGSAESQVQDQAKSYNTVIAQCKQYYGGIGSSVVPTTASTPASLATTVVAATALPSACAAVTDLALSDSQLSSIKSSIRTFSVVLIVIGLATAASGWFMREGRKWTRRVLIGVVLVQLVLAFLFQVSNTITLLSTLLIVVGLSTTFLGKASAYFMGVALRKNQH
ncbi:UPF0716 family protein affecting phage T7 exclusion [Nakamurella sp. UYEF19]